MPFRRRYLYCFLFLSLPSVAAAQTISSSAQQSGAQTQSGLVNQPCPDLSTLYSLADPDWAQIEQQLTPLQPRCLQSTEYYAVLGAAQMNTGKLTQALESLERALLLAPDNGAAQIDYAQALYLQGQLFSALELNRQILQRNDLPLNLAPMLDQRQRDWQAMTRQFVMQADVLAGYDNNLNGAPSPDQITLTLTGESVILPLNPEYRPAEGPYLNLRLGGRYRQLAPMHQHNVLVELRGRISEHPESDLLQLDTRYAYIQPGRHQTRQFSAGMSHLMFGGSPLYTASEIGGRLQLDTLGESNACRPHAAGAAQHQYFYSQSRLNAYEVKMGAGVTCPVSNRLGRQIFMPEFSVLYSDPIGSGRPGGAREGWQVNLDWQLDLGRSSVSAQVNHTRTLDESGYSPLLSDGARRRIKRSYILVQYRQAVTNRSSLLVNLYSQDQSSNLELFRSNDTTVEVGFNYRF